MSDKNKNLTSVLLPAASVALFANDSHTHEVIASLKEDWRFTRVSIELFQGDIAAATAAFENVASPDLLIIQTEHIDEAFTDSLSALAANCSEGTAAIIIGPVNDVYLYRKMIDMGVSDYLVKPLDQNVIADVIAKTLIERRGVSDSRLIAFIGAKGGVGASALLQGAAWGVSDILQQKTIVLDVAGGWSSLSVGMGYEPSATLQEAAKAAESGNEEALKRLIFKAGDRLGVLATGSDVMLEQTISPDQLETLIDMLMVKHPCVLADLSEAPPVLCKTVIARANQVVIVSLATLASLRQARSLIQEAKDLRGGSEEGIELIVNMQGMAASSEVSKKDIKDAMGRIPSAIIPFLPQAFTATENEGKRIIDHKDGLEIIRQSVLPVVQKTLAVFVEEDEPIAQGSGILGGFLNKIKTK